MEAEVIFDSCFPPGIFSEIDEGDAGKGYPQEGRGILRHSNWAKLGANIEWLWIQGMGMRVLLIGNEQ